MSHLTLQTDIPSSIATVVFKITDHKKKTVKLTCPSGGSVQHPTQKGEAPWIISAILVKDINDPYSSSSTTEAQIVHNLNAALSCSIDVVLAKLSGGESSSGSVTPPQKKPEAPVKGGGEAPEQPPLGAELHLDMEHQEQDQWCWAAVAVSVGNFYDEDRDLEQCAVVNDSFDREDCCGDVVPSACNQPNLIEDVIRDLGNLDQYYGEDIDFDAVTGEIDAGSPVVVGIDWGDDSGHYVAIDGYSVGATGDLINVKDPWDGGGIFIFDDFPASINADATWDETCTTKAA